MYIRMLDDIGQTVSEFILPKLQEYGYDEKWMPNPTRRIMYIEEGEY